MDKSIIVSQFDFSNKIIQLDQMLDKKEELTKKIEVLERSITELKKELPDEVIVLYEQLRVIDKLKGEQNEIKL